MMVTGTDLLGSQAIGTVIAQRYELKAVAGHGGMGTVFRARDLHHDRWVALKLLLGDVSQANHAERFAREVAILAQLRHPNIVAYLEHGHTSAGQPFLIMEWLEGEELATRLQRGPLSLTESLHVISQATAALVATHERGFVHRDIKPSNLFLRQGSLDAVTLLDFGVARSIARTPTLTKTGALIGTIDYMAPEQARGQRELGPAVDVYSLGCVLFECLIGRPPFVSDSMAGLFARILLEAAPPLRSILDWLPMEVELLVQRMLDKDPLRRPYDAASLLAELRILGTFPNHGTTTLPQLAAPQQALTEGELFLVSVVIGAPHASKLMAETTLDLEQSVYESHQRQQLRETLRRFDATIEFFPDGTIVSTLMRSGVATDQAGQAARYALALQALRPALRVSLATGRAELRYSVPMGEAIDRALKQLPVLESAPGVYVDEVSAGLLQARFTIAQANGHLVLQAERPHDEEAPLLLGKPTPCVGREQELTVLAAVLKSCIEDPRSRIVLVTAPAGGGKSRLRHEFLSRQRLLYPEVEVLFGVADPMSAGSPYATLGQLLRRLCGVVAGAPLVTQQQKLRERIGRHLAAPQTPQVVAFLGELCGVAFPADENSLLGAARQDPKLMDQQVTLAFTHWLAAECRHRPQLLILEDLHWADALTVRLLDAALRGLAQQPIMCLAVARCEIAQMFGGLWSTRARYDLRLGGLSRKASESLMREALGNQLDRQTVHRIITQSAGNALYLEELIRAVAVGKGDELPATLRAMMQARLIRLPKPERRLLRAASIFGNTFWDNGLRTLMGKERAPAEVDAGLESLLTSELIERKSVSRFPGAIEYRFRHALLQDAAYVLLTESDRQLGHHLAGVYLESAGEADAIVLAEQAERCADTQRAARFLVRAAEQSLARNDLETAAQRAERGIAASEPGSRWWYQAKTLQVSLALHHAQLDRLNALVNEFTTVKPQADARADYIDTTSRLVITLCFLGRRKLAAAHLATQQAAVDLCEDSDSKSRGIACTAAAWYERLLMPHPYSALMLAQKAATTLEPLLDYRQLVMSQLVLALSWADLGNLDAGKAVLRQSVLWMEQIGDVFTATTLKGHLAMLLAHGENEDERADAEVLVQSVLAVSPNSIPGGMSRLARAQMMLVAGQLEAAAAEVHQAIALLGMMRPLALLAMATLLEILLKQEHYRAASALATEALQIKNELGLSGGQVVFLLVRCAETYHALGDPVHAHDTLCDIMEQLHLRLDDIPDVLMKRRFLTQVPENARALALARTWLADSTSGWLTEPSLSDRRAGRHIVMFRSGRTRRYG